MIVKDIVTGITYNLQEISTVPVGDPLYLTKMLNRPRVALVVGHTSGEGLCKDMGAVDVGGMTEYEFWESYVLNADVIDKLNAHFFLHDENDNSYTSRQTKMAERTKDFDLVLELHFNASDSEQANGSEALYYFNNVKTKLLATKFTELMTARMQYTNRGAKPIYSPNDRGHGFLSKMKGDALVLEPFFGTNADDCKKFSQDKFTRVLQDLIDYYGTIKK